MNNLLNKEEKQLWLLIDPEKESDREVLELKFSLAQKKIIHAILIGGSTLQEDHSGLVVEVARSYGLAPLIGFPGCSKQVFNGLDGMLFTSLVSSNNPRFLVEEQRNAIWAIQNAAIPTLSCGYLLSDPHCLSSTARVSQHAPADTDHLVRSALVAQFMGMQSIYIEGGSGAQEPISAELIQLLREKVDLPIIAGGGLRTFAHIQDVWDAGANVAVIGTVVEQDPHFLATLPDRTSAHENHLNFHSHLRPQRS